MVVALQVSSSCSPLHTNAPPDGDIATVPAFKLFHQLVATIGLYLLFAYPLEGYEANARNMVSGISMKLLH